LVIWQSRIKLPI